MVPFHKFSLIESWSSPGKAIKMKWVPTHVIDLVRLWPSLTFKVCTNTWCLQIQDTTLKFGSEHRTGQGNQLLNLEKVVHLIFLTKIYDYLQLWKIVLKTELAKTMIVSLLHLENMILVTVLTKIMITSCLKL